MKRFAKILIGWLVCWSAQGEDWAVVLFLVDPKESGTVWEWVVPSERLSAPENAWDLDSGKFPADLNCYCAIARSNVMARHRWTSTPEVALIHIRRVLAPLKSHSACPPLPVVVISFHFREPGTGLGLGPVQPVVMLLDGTIATMRKCR